MTDVFTPVLHPFRGYRLGRRLRSIAALSAALFEVALRGFVHLNLPDMLKLFDQTLSFLGGVVKAGFVGAGGEIYPDGTVIIPFHDSKKGMRIGPDSQDLTNPDGAKFKYRGIKVIRTIGDEELTSSAGGAVRHDQVSEDAQRAELERKLAALS